VPFIDDESPQKLRGGYYTPPDLALFLCRWALRAGPGPVLEPSCGDGAFLRALSRAGAGGRRVIAVEADAHEARTAAAAGAALELSVHTGDFLAWALARQGQPGELAAVVGNPPYIRYQYLPRELQDRAAALIRGHGLRFTRHTNAWVPFVVAAVALLRPGGRLAMVLPSELLHVLHAQSLRDFLLQECSSVAVLDPEELWFARTLQGTVLVMAQRKRDPEEEGQLTIVPVRGRAFVERSAEELLAGRPPVPARELGGKWMPALLGPSERGLLRDLGARPEVRTLGEVAEVSVGIVTGANKFFLVPESTVEAHGLRPWARPMFGRSEHVPGVVYDAAQHSRNVDNGLPTSFLGFGLTEPADLPPGARAYVAAGETEGLHRRYKCRIRSPWTAVPSVWAAPVAMLKRCHDLPRLVRNHLGALTTDTAYRLRPKTLDPDALVGGFVSSLTALSAELEGRHYGGGVLELVPSEIRRLAVVPAADGAEAVARLDSRVRGGRPAEAVLAEQDAEILGPIGLAPADQERLRSAWDALRRRRQR
jgi:adenine-specific DNA methylase